MKVINLKYLLIVLAVISIVVLYLIGRVPQYVQYHQFADADILYGISNFHNVISNLPFLFIGLLGMIFLKRNNHFSDVYEKAMCWVLFLGISLLCFGSGYYHISPDNASLVWDRLPMTLIFSSLFSVILWDYLDQKTGRLAFVFFLPVGILSVFYWWYTELNGMGDLRPYIFMQFFPMLCIPVILIFSSNRKNTKSLILILVFYSIAKFFEIFDISIMEYIGYGGHALKHFFAAIATYFIYDFMKRRVIVYNKL